MGNPTIDPSKKAPTRSHNATERREDAEAASNHRHSPVNAGWTEVPAPAGPHAPQHLPPPLLHSLPIAPSIIRLCLPTALVQPSACCGSGWQQATCPISVTTKGAPAGQQGGAKRGSGSTSEEESQLG